MLGPTMTLDTVVEVLLISIGTISGQQKCYLPHTIMHFLSLAMLVSIEFIAIYFVQECLSLRPFAVLVVCLWLPTTLSS